MSEERESALGQSVSDLQRRMGVLEGAHEKTLTRIFDKLEELRKDLNTMNLKMAEEKKCPRPGMCLSVDSVVTSLTQRVTTLEGRVDDLSKWRFGVAAVIAFVAFAVGIGATLAKLFL